MKKSECPICSATVSDQQPLTCVPCCNASFHTRCLQQYEEKLENHEFRCPACRQDLTVYDPAKIGLPKVYPNPQRWSVDGGIEFVCKNLHPEEEEVRVTVANNVWLQVRRAIDLLGGADGPLYFNDIPITMDNTAATVDLVQSATQPIGSSLGKWRFRFIPKYTRDGYNGVEIALAQWAQFGRLDGKFMVFKEGRFVVIVYTAPISRKRRRIG